VSLFRRLGREARLPLLESETPIQPVIVGAAGRTVDISRRLWERGLFVQGFRPPTVPEGSSRLRVTLSAAHDREQIARLVDELAKALEETGGGR
jgi:8-amino-7-oxononanoate synthase